MKKFLIALTGDAPPSTFRIFTAGKVDTRKGMFLFDAKSAASVMQAYRANGIDLMIDYAHASLDGTPVDPALSGKAAGWFNLEVRNGELWAVNVRWTPPAAAALSRKEWRFMSPAFETDAKGRITSLLNVAITNLPATRRLQPLVAASAKGKGMTLQELVKVAKALGLDMTSSVDEVMAKLKGDPDADTEDAPPPAGDGGADEGNEPPAAAAAAPCPPGDDKEKPMPQAASVAAATAVALAVTGKSSIGEAMAELTRTHKLAVELEGREAKLASDRAALESGERRGLVAQLVKLGCETPATAWGDEKGTVPCARLASEPMGDLRTRVKALTAAKGKQPAPPAPPASGSAVALGLTDAEFKICSEMGCEPKDFLALRALRDSVKVG